MKLYEFITVSLVFSILLVSGFAEQYGSHSPAGSCDSQPCPEGLCCSKWGWCGNTTAYCSPENCQSQCPQGPSPAGACGPGAGGAPCPDGLCCSRWGWCGNTNAYCSPENCESQCPEGPSPNLPLGLVEQYGSHSPAGSCDSQPCPEGLCCSKWGWCGNTTAYCSPENCQSQCPQGPSPAGACGPGAGGAPCPDGLCCSRWGWCGNTDAYCSPENCESQCPEGPSPNLPLGLVEKYGSHSPAGSCDSQPCLEGLCCSKWGWCGNTTAYCSPENCQSQCPQGPSPAGACGPGAGGAPCPDGLCCSRWGWCGNTDAYCSPENCESQCPEGPSPNLPLGLVEQYASHSPAGSCDSQPCPEGLCCSKWGWCGNTTSYCSPENCQSQCPQGPSPAGACGPGAGGALCPDGLCCSRWGWCGNTNAYCAPENCESQCRQGPSPNLPLGLVEQYGSHSPAGSCSSQPCPEGLCCSKWGYCGNTDAYCSPENCQSQCPDSPSPNPPPSPSPPPSPGPPPGPPGDLSSVIPKSLYDKMLMHRNDVACEGKGDFYSYDAFITAASSFPSFGTTGDITARKREIAAFFGQTSHETTGGWPDAPDGEFAWGYCFINEIGKPSGYCMPNNQWPCAPGKSYYGRGPIQISYNYNYGPCGKAIGEDLLNNPDIVARDSVISFESALWFWMTPQPPKPSCHDVILGRWQPSNADIAANRLPGYGVCTNIINGGLECGHGNDTRVQNRIGFYKRFCEILGVSPGDNLDCGNQRPFGSGLLVDTM